MKPPTGHLFATPPRKSKLINKIWYIATRYAKLAATCRAFGKLSSLWRRLLADESSLAMYGPQVSSCRTHGETR
jgi:hypothetical protein